MAVSSSYFMLGSPFSGPPFGDGEVGAKQVGGRKSKERTAIHDVQFLRAYPEFPD